MAEVGGASPVCLDRRPRHQHMGREGPTVLSEVLLGTFRMGMGTTHRVRPRCSEKTWQKLPAHVRLVTGTRWLVWTQRLIGSSEKFQPWQQVLWHLVLNAGIIYPTNLGWFGGRLGWEPQPDCWRLLPRDGWAPEQAQRGVPAAPSQITAPLSPTWALLLSPILRG